MRNAEITLLPGDDIIMTVSCWRFIVYKRLEIRMGILPREQIIHVYVFQKIHHNHFDTESQEYNKIWSIYVYIYVILCIYYANVGGKKFENVEHLKKK